ncbi:hypothetical protein P0Y35_15860 [Kiritimatiellaeota bacterium B1221]|nr:hypothetical protein [Kiritimatiellaeota bacterium B1221]
MKTMVKIFLVLNLLLCLGVLAFGIKTFRDREIVKARTVIHRQHLQEIASRLEWGQKHDWEQEAKAGTFQLPDPANMEEFGAFTSQLKELTNLAELRVSQLNEQYTSLTEAQEVLEEAKATLATRETELSGARSRVAKLETDLTNSTQSLQDTNSKIATLTTENDSLQATIADLDKEITDQQTLISSVKSELELRTVERDKARELLAACLRPANTTNDVEGPWPGKTATILAVEPEWNYVVIDKGEVDVLPMFMEAFIHRGDQFVGKIRVMKVENTVALAEILPETLTPGLTVEAGDTIFF